MTRPDARSDAFQSARGLGGLRLLFRLFAALIFFSSLCTARDVDAHPLDTATLTLTEEVPSRFLVHFRAGSTALQRELVVPAVFPKQCRVVGAYLECGPSGLVGPIEFPWLEGTLTRLMVEIEWHGGSRLLRIVTASAPRLVVYGAPASGWLSLEPIAVDYTRLGVEHILTGFDHVCFVLALAFLARGKKRLIATITAFTLAHSLTLACTALGVLSVPAAPVEATIALSIVLACVECLRPTDSFTRRFPWIVAFTFGLLHGLGFASALLEIGLPERHVAAALFCFNLGVELGQLAVVGAGIALGALAARLGLKRRWLSHGVIYAMGSIAAFWSIERIGGIFGP